ncbi:stage II sporulation protein E [Leptospira gomenensis]|uniref:Stage II sporulation protein E n=1 Tax=Leptospira gomenensis TaxID=2484974 RepID=A0A5F1YFX8_9LEPT|nr:PP2C family protein-serine/threonine phosphatase [Leptospira gomenensis]TGK38663.1 stage II sporulation protein E [Leptospira gomenensis]TGK42900.1 stage II sporulation protein E [Leptospira gomenensis]TGK49555.1 stage II sporulation protein E [Leptospira gomenensis]TGK60775.1 stage II sporulation protein E [Leptospira gomenensis]
MNFSTSIRRYLRLIFDIQEDRIRYSKEYLDDLHRQSRFLHYPGSILGIFVWLGFAFDTDRKLHPEFPELFYFRIGLSLFCVFFLSLLLIDRIRGTKFRGKGLEWAYVLFLYLLNATAFFTGRIADDPNYVSGLQIVVMSMVFMPFPRRALFSLYLLSIFFFLTSVLIYKPNLSTGQASYSMQNLAISYVVAFFSGFIVERYRFSNFLSHYKILEKNREISETMQQIQSLKEKQDGDYFLTSLLLNPLIATKTEDGPVRIEFALNQYKKFMFRDKEYELGGDYLSAYDLILQGKKFKAFINGDAMGKSIQGAGGALVLGAVYNSVVIRSKMDPDSSDRSPERWLKDCFTDLQKVFETFDGSMLVSAVLGLVEEETGTLYYLNIEHPWLVLYRDGVASFIDPETHFYKLGVSGVGGAIYVRVFSMRPGDKIFCGSDGKDDLVLEEHSTGKRTINEDENEFLRRVEEASGELADIEKKLLSVGRFSDDYSLLSIEYDKKEKIVFDSERFSKAKEAALSKNFDQALRIYEETKHAQSNSPEDWKLIARLQDKLGDAEAALRSAYNALNSDPGDHELLLYLSLLTKRIYSKTKDVSLLKRGEELSEKFRLRFPDHVKNLIHLADLYRLQGNRNRSLYLLEKATELDPKNDRIAELRRLLS